MWENNLPRAVLFDNDGVLIASEGLHWAAWEKLLSEMGIPYNSAEMREFIGKTAPEILLELLNRYLPGWDPARFDVVALALKKNDYYLENARTSLRTYPGVPEMLAWLKSRGVRIAVVTNAKRRELEASLVRTGIATLFDVMVSRDEVSIPKPDPAPYSFAVAHLGLKPSECLAVEDSVPGLSAALLAGIPSAAVLTNFPASAMERPLPQRPELAPIWVGPTPMDLFSWFQALVR